MKYFRITFKSSGQETFVVSINEFLIDAIEEIKDIYGHDIVFISIMEATEEDYNKHLADISEQIFDEKMKMVEIFKNILEQYQ